MYFQTAGTAKLACIIPTCPPGRRTYILEAEELVAAVAAQRSGVRQQLLQRRRLRRVGVLLCNRVASCWAGRGLQRRQYVPLSVLLPSETLTAPDLRRPKNELMVAARSDGRAEQWGADEVVVVRRRRAYAARAYAVVARTNTGVKRPGCCRRAEGSMGGGVKQQRRRSCRAAHTRHSSAAQHTRDEQRPVVLNQPESDEAWRS